MGEENKENRLSPLASHYKREEEIANLVLDPNTPPKLAARLARSRPWLINPARSLRAATTGAIVKQAAHSKAVER